MTNNIYDVIIVGSGPAGLTAATYASRANLKTVIIAGEKWGGQLMLTTEVENYPGFGSGVLGPKLMEEMRKQATRFGAEWVGRIVKRVEFSNTPFKIWTADDQLYEGRSVIVAVGAEAMWLGVEGEQKLIGRGVSSCAPCDAAFFKDKRVFVVGGGDAAMEEALVLTKFASEVTVLHRRDAFRASKIMEGKVLNHEKVKVFWDTEVEKIIGEQVVEKVVLKTKLGRWQKDKQLMLERGKGRIVEEGGESVTWEAEIDGVFVAIGHKPSTGLFKDQLVLDKKGYLVNQITDYKLPSSAKAMAGRQITNNGNYWLMGYPTMASVSGVFVVGDGFDYRYKQAVTAAGYGCMGAMDAEKWLEDNS